MLRAAVYTRYSTENQRTTSTADQLRNGQRLIQQEGWRFVGHFSDEAVSGGTADRADYQRMLVAARKGEFDILVLDELSRAWRDQVEAESTIRRLEFAGIRIIGISDGYDSNHKARKTIRLLANFKNELAIDEARDRTHRGQAGQALQKLSAGGLPYGYRSVPRTANDLVVGYDREPHPQHAPILQEIFRRVAAGESQMAVVSDLNDRGVPSPGARWRRKHDTRQLWQVSTVHSILGNEVYIGRYIWNQSRWEKDPDTKVRKRILRPRSEWVVHDIPQWRLVDDLTWQRVQRRRQERSDLFGQRKGGRPTYLLSGILRCGECGGPYTIQCHKPIRYGCATAKSCGTKGCTNTIRVSKDLAETRILASVIAELLSEEAIDAGVAEMRRLAAAEATQPAQVDSDELRRLDDQIAQLEQLRDQGALMPSLAAAALQRADSERLALRRRLAERLNAPVIGMFNAAQAYAEAMRELRQTLRAEDMPSARDAIQEILGTVRLVPEGGVLIAEVRSIPLPLSKAVGMADSVAPVKWIGSGGRIWSQFTRIPLVP